MGNEQEEGNCHVLGDYIGTTTTATTDRPYVEKITSPCQTVRVPIFLKLAGSTRKCNKGAQTLEHIS